MIAKPMISLVKNLKDMITINPYIYFDGNCEEAFKFYESVFSKKISSISKYKDVPEPQRNIFQESDDRIMHVTLPLSKETMLNGSDNSLAYEETVKHKTFTLIVHTKSKKEVDDIFGKLCKHGQIIVPVDMTFWGAYYGHCIDKYGISWKITLASTN